MYIYIYSIISIKVYIFKFQIVIIYPISFYKNIFDQIKLNLHINLHIVFKKKTFLNYSYCKIKNISILVIHIF